MKLNGSLVFDASGLSQIENLRVEKVSSLPSFANGDIGRLVYITGSEVLWLGGASNWIPLATGGDASSLATEIANLETSLGSLINQNGTYNFSSITGTLANSTDFTDLISKIQNLIAANNANLQTEIGRATNAETILQTNVGNEVTRATSAEGTIDSRVTTEIARATAAELVNTNAISTETTRATAAELVNTNAISTETTRATAAENVTASNLTNEVNRATAAELVNTTAISTETTRAQGVEGQLQTDLTTEVNRATAAELVNTTAVSDEAVRATAAENALDGRITTEVSDRTAAINTAATNLATEVTDRIDGDALVQTHLDSEITRATGVEQQILSQIQSGASSLFWKDAARVTTIGNISLTSAASGYDDVVLNIGERVLVKDQSNQSENGIYIFQGTGNALTRSADADADAEVFGFAIFVKEGTVFHDTGWTETTDSGTINSSPIVFVQFYSGIAGLTGGAGTYTTGNVLNVGNVDGSITINAADIQIAQAVRDEITSNATAVAAEATRAKAAEGGLDGRITDEVTARIASNNDEVTARDAAILVETNRATAAELVNTTAISTETTRAQGVEGQLQTDLTTEVNRATAAELVNTTAISTETTRAQGVEGQLQTDLTTEVNRATASELVNTTAISTETTRAQGVEGQLQTDLTTEVNRATASELDLSNRITAAQTGISSLYFLYSGGSAPSHSVNHNLGQQYCNVTVVDSDDEVVIPQSIHFDSTSSLTVSFNSSIACKVIVMGVAQ